MLWCASLFLSLSSLAPACLRTQPPPSHHPPHPFSFSLPDLHERLDLQESILGYYPPPSGMRLTHSHLYTCTRSAKWKETNTFTLSRTHSHINRHIHPCTNTFKHSQTYSHIHKHITHSQTHSNIHHFTRLRPHTIHTRMALSPARGWVGGWVGGWVWV